MNVIINSTFVVLEAANGEYGNVTEQLAKKSTEINWQNGTSRCKYYNGVVTFLCWQPSTLPSYSTNPARSQSFRNLILYAVPTSLML